MRLFLFALISTSKRKIEKYKKAAPVSAAFEELNQAILDDN